MRDSFRRLNDRRTEFLRLIQKLHDLRQMPQPEHLNAFRHRRFGRVVEGQQQVFDSFAGGADRDGKSAANRAQAAVERQFADQQMVFGFRNCTHGAKNGRCHGQVEARAFLAQVSRRKINGDGFTRVAVTGVQQSRFNPFPALLHGGIRHAHCDKVARRTGRVHIDFDVDQVRVDALDGSAKSAKKGHASLVAAGLRCSQAAASAGSPWVERLAAGKWATVMSHF